MHSFLSIISFEYAAPLLLYLAGKAVTGGSFGQGSGPVAMSEVQCSPANTKLLQCYSSPLLSGGCSTTNGAGVRCEGEWTN